MQMWILKPPGFDPKKKWPLVFLVHGGPQGAWEDGWSYRWNPEVWAAQGYVVALPNPRGSTGFGQKYRRRDQRRLGRQVLRRPDGRPRLPGEAALHRQGPHGRGRRVVRRLHDELVRRATPTKFKTLITHCGVWNFDSMYATTDELWFDEWEHGGPPWDKDKRESYEKFSPHRYADKFKTPMLIIHNDLDFRVPVSEGHAAVHHAAAAGRPVEVHQLPRRGALGAEAEEQRILAQGSVRLAGEVRPAGSEVRG